MKRDPASPPAEVRTNQFAPLLLDESRQQAAEEAGGVIRGRAHRASKTRVNALMAASRNDHGEFFNAC
jgi:hypothetical protein